MRQLSNHGHNLPGYIIGTAETQEFLTKLKAHPFLPAGADELLKVNSIREHRSHFAIVGLVRHPKRRTIRRTYLLFMGCREEGALLLQLERRQKTELLSSPRLERNTVFFLLSILMFVIFTALCVFSHPSVARLPQFIYFSCLGTSFLSFFFAVYFGILLRRSE